MSHERKSCANCRFFKPAETRGGCHVCNLYPVPDETQPQNLCIHWEKAKPVPVPEKAAAVETPPAPQAEKPPKENHESLPIVYTCYVPVIRDLARKLGYAVAVHGSMTNDLDLVAVPWVENCSPAVLLAEAVREAVLGRIVHPSPGIKPHGRLVWTILLDHGYIDLSIMPVTL